MLSSRCPLSSTSPVFSSGCRCWGRTGTRDGDTRAGTRDDPPGDEGETTEHRQEDRRLTPAAASLAPASGFGERADAFGEIPIWGQEVVLAAVALSRCGYHRGAGGRVGSRGTVHGEQCECSGEQQRAEPIRRGGEVGSSHVLCLPSGA